ncbi:hypothetical protein D082_09950 [Synechocystis sp. PCC 6714]|nr:hypothetical protein D082_09950 [Synechocystis sp. PCC 6714]
MPKLIVGPLAIGKVRKPQAIANLGTLTTIGLLIYSRID